MAIHATVVRDVMSTALITVAPTDDLSVALARMSQHRVRRLPVVEQLRGDAVVVGMISDRDIRLAANSPFLWGTTEDIVDELRQLRVADVMAQPVATVFPDAPVTAAAKLMIDHAIGGLPVVRQIEGRPCLVGVVTRTDLLAHLIRLEHQLDTSG
jgi:CBS domain-containing protein